jgi:outer membrane lipoprotein SlyB
MPWLRSFCWCFSVARSDWKLAGGAGTNRLRSFSILLLEARMRLLLVLLVLHLIAVPAGAQQRNVRPDTSVFVSIGAPIQNTMLVMEMQRPLLTPGRVTGQFASGVLGGVIGLSAVLVTGNAVARMTGRDPDDPWDPWMDNWLGAAVLAGYPLASATGVHLAGSRGNQRGSFLATLGGTLAGAVAGLALEDALNANGQVYMVMVPVGGTIGFNMSRRYREPVQLQR